MFLTRIPCPKIDYSEEILNDCARYFPVVGLVIGGLNYLVFWVLFLVFPKEIAILLSMSFSFILTGGFHEDGMADSCDAFGGGYTKERVLEIMKDSRIGSFGALGLFSVLLIKFHSLLILPETSLLPAFLLGHSLSRVLPIWVMKFLPYVQFEGKSKPIAKEPKPITFGMTSFFALLILSPFVFLSPVFLSLLIPLFFFLPVVIFFLKRKIGGYTGDTLGSAQQISEILIYLGLYLCKFI